MAAVRHDLKNKRVFNDLNCRENISMNILALKEIYGMKNKKRLLWCILSVMGDSVSSRSPSLSLSLPLCVSLLPSGGVLMEADVTQALQV